MNGEIPMKKIALLAVLLAAVLLLSSCNLVVKDEAVDAATVILKMGDTEVTKAQVQDATQDQLLQMYQYYGMLGHQVDMKDPAVIADAQNAAVTALKHEIINSTCRRNSQVINADKAFRAQLSLNDLIEFQ